MSWSIKTEKLGKKYRRGEVRVAYDLRDALGGVLKRIISNGVTNEGVSLEEHEFWAVKDLDLEVQAGEVVGIIGRNGAGKSTLLKLLSRITPPTVGMARCRGRVAALLEVGTGFHRDLTGRENVFLNGAILGMRRMEIAAKLDEIVAFAEAEDYLDTPVRFYSSGMHLRLGFAVAAFLQADILLVDEVLAVGDLAFQRRCMGKMDDVAKDGRTVLMISHNIHAVRQLCPRVIWLAGGAVAMDGSRDEVVMKYLQEIPAADSLADVGNLICRLPPDPVIRLLGISISQEGRNGNRVVNGKTVEISIAYEVMKATHGLRVFFEVSDIEKTPIFRSFAHGEAPELSTMEPGRYVSKAVIPADLLAPITYEVGISATIAGLRRCFPEDIIVNLYVEDSGHLKHSYAYPITLKMAPVIPWTTERMG